LPRPNKMKRTIIFIFLIVILAGILFQNRPVWNSKTKEVMGTFVEIRFFAEEAKADVIMAGAFNEIKRVQERLSKFLEHSEVSFINQRASQEPISLSDEAFHLIKTAMEITRISNGAFDITKGTQGVTLNQEDNSISFADSSVKIDLAGIAKGYAVDQAVYILRKNNISRAMVNAGGDLYCFGNGPDGGDWRIGIEDPRHKEKYLTRVRLHNQAIASSGAYYQQDHIIDPATGKPVENNVLSASVIAPDCATADALATALFVMGRKAGFEMIEKLSGIEAIVIDQVNGEVVISNTSGAKLE